MNKLKILSVRDITFKEGCELYLDNCRERNLREGTIEHYKNSYKQLYKFFNPNMPISQINSDMYKKYVLYLRERISNDVSINAYLRDFITTMRFLMSEEYVPHFKLRAIKVDKPNVETYTEEELNCLLQKPNIKKCSFIEYQAWVMTSFLFSTGVRQRSLINILIKDIDFDNDIVHVNVTKNRKPLLVPINMTMSNILREFLKHRQHKNTDEYLFCNVFGKQLVKSTCYTMLYNYNKQRGIQKTGIHRYRHTFAKQWILNGGRQLSVFYNLGATDRDIITDKESGKNLNRNGYQALKNTLLRSGDTLVIKSLDRLSRNKADIRNELEYFKNNGIRLKVIDLPTTMMELPEGQTWVFEMVNNILIEVLGTIAEQERLTIRQRQREGIDSAKEKGKHLGRPKASLPDNYDDIICLWKNGDITAKEAMSRLGIKKSTFYSTVRKG